jgi:cytochrome c biogenesis protein CcdA/thiol-disulfide isomerase/thioredoxin
MLFLILAYLGGVLTILSPCILPVLPFVFARSGRPFRSHGLPLLIGLALAFAAVATLAAVGGAWAASLGHYGRYLAMALFAVFGLRLLFPSLAGPPSGPLFALAVRIGEVPASERPGFRSVLSALLQGAGTGMLWTPCAGPIHGLILTGAAIRGASLGSSLLLLAYAGGAATSLAAALLFGGRLMARMKRSFATGERVRRAAGAAVLAGVTAIALGLDTGVLAGLALGSTARLEKVLVARIDAVTPQPLATATAPATLAAVLQPVAPSPLRIEGMLPPLSGATEWINSPPLTREGLRGKVVLVDFWTYSCINCLRTLPYVRAWAEKYRDAGLVVIGVHTPEFAFEKRSANVHQAVKDLRVGFPVAVDSDFALWRAFGNDSWPAFYFIDAQGRIRHQQVGENQYRRAEQVLQQLLAEAGQATVPAGLVAPAGEGTQAAPGGSWPQSHETYLGHGKARDFASPGGIAGDRIQAYQAPTALKPGQWALAGDWRVERERVVLAGGGGRIAMRFHARDLHLVLGAAAYGKPVRFRVLVDGQAPLQDHGADTDAQGAGTVRAQRLYQLVRQAGGGRERLFEIQFLDPGVQAHAFTFG